MPRLIDADELAVDVLRLTIVDPTAAAYADAVLRLMQHAPTIEAEPVRHGRWEAVIEEEDPTQYIDTGIKPSGKLFAARREPCSFCGWGNSVHVHSVKLSDANVEAELRYSDDGTLTVTDHKGKSFEMKLPYCPSCGKKKDGDGEKCLE